jgi:hypothetical protein
LFRNANKSGTASKLDLNPATICNYIVLLRRLRVVILLVKHVANFAQNDQGSSFAGFIFVINGTIQS